MPATGAYVGAIVPAEPNAIRDFNATIGVQHAVFLSFYAFPAVALPGNPERDRLRLLVSECRDAGAIPAITIETGDGLYSYKPADVEEFARLLDGFAMPMFLRWNHEMNGSWYAWGQQPGRYVKRFREFAEVIHRAAPSVAMVWTPNQGWGYPWPRGAHASLPSSPDFALLDSNADGRFDELDDPYSPYYPGDDYVDWVGISFYHWSDGEHRGANQVPWAEKWVQAVSGSRSVDFHREFAVRRGKPMMVAETSALFDPGDRLGGHAAEEDIKGAWIRQVYDVPRLQAAFPQIKAIFWFNLDKYEQEVDGVVSWRVDANPRVRAEYCRAVAPPYFIKAEGNQDALLVVAAPETVQAGGSYQVRVEYKASGDRSIVANLLNPANNYSWHGGGALAVAPGRAAVQIRVQLEGGIEAGTNYLWDVFIAPPGGDWRKATAKVQVPAMVAPGPADGP